MDTITTYLIGFVLFYLTFNYVLPAIPILRPIHSNLSLFFTSMCEVADTFNASYIDEASEDEEEEEEEGDRNEDRGKKEK